MSKKSEKEKENQAKKLSMRYSRKKIPMKPFLCPPHTKIDIQLFPIMPKTMQEKGM